MANADSSETVKHLRTVHFSLVLVCALIIISLLATSPGQVNTAYKQLQKILTIKTDLQKWTKEFGTEQITWLQQHNRAWPDTVKSVFDIPRSERKRENLPDRTGLWAVTFLYSPAYLFVDIPRLQEQMERKEILAHVQIYNNELYVQPSGQIPVDPPLLDTLEDFQRFWNSVNNVRAFVVTKISPIAYWISGGSIEAELRLSPRSESANGISDLLLWTHGRKQEKNQSLSKCPETISTLFQSRWSDEFNEYFCGETVIEDTFLLVPVVSKSEYLSTNLRIWLARKYDFQTIGGTFEETFPELNDVTKYYQTVPLDNAHNILKSELLRSGNVVEILGLKIPESIISTWGPIILLNIQLYLWLHLRACRERLTLSDPALNVAWVGIYPDFWSRLTSLISISLLPIGVVLYMVAWSGWFSWIIGLLIPELLLAFGSACIIWPLAQTRESDIGANPS